MADASASTPPAAAGTQTAATPAAVATPAAAFDAKAFSDTLKSAVADAVKPLHDQIAELRKARPDETPKTLSAEDITGILEKRDQARATTEAANTARNNYVAESMKGIPAAYVRDLPVTADKAVLAAEGEKIRLRYREDLKNAGVTAPNVAGGASGGAAPGAMVDTGKLTAGQKIELSISRSAMKGAPGRK